MILNKRSVLTFGANKGKPLHTCSDNYLQWMVGNLTGTDFHLWAMEAKKLLAERTRTDTSRPDLEAAADEILRRAGCGDLTKKIQPGRRRWRP